MRQFTTIPRATERANLDPGSAKFRVRPVRDACRHYFIAR